MNNTVAYYAKSAITPKRLAVLAISMLLLALIAFLSLLQYSPQAIQYPQRFLAATPSEVCPGDTFTYPVSIKIAQKDAVSRITEGWCRASDGICPKQLQSEPYYVNFIDPYFASATATRTVPLDLSAGEWQLRHCNEAHATRVLDVVCYQVDITVKDCQPK